MQCSPERADPTRRAFANALQMTYGGHRPHCHSILPRDRYDRIPVIICRILCRIAPWQPAVDRLRRRAGAGDRGARPGHPGQPGPAGRRCLAPPVHHGDAGNAAQHRCADGRRRARRGGDRHRLRLAGDDDRVSRPALAGLGLVPAAGDAGLRERLRLQRPAAIRRPGADQPAQPVRLAARRLLVSRFPVAAGRGGAVHCQLLPLRLHAGARRLPRPVGLRAGGRPHARARPLVALLAHRAAAGAADDRRRRRAGADGNPGRFRRRELARRADLHHRDLPHLVRHGRCHHRSPAGRRAADLRAGRRDAGTHQSSGQTLPPHVRAHPAAALATPAAGPRHAGDHRLPVADPARLRRAGRLAAASGNRRRRPARFRPPGWLHHQQLHSGRTGGRAADRHCPWPGLCQPAGAAPPDRLADPAGHHGLCRARLGDRHRRDPAAGHLRPCHQPLGRGDVRRRAGPAAER